MASEIKVDTVSEKTSGSGVTIDGLLIKDGGISGDVSLIGTTPTFTIGDAGAEDAALVFDGNAQDFYIALDDSADDLVIGLGSTVGTTPAISINEDRDVTISDGAIDFNVASHDGSNGLKLGGTLVTATAAELNLIDGGTARGTTAIADGDGVLINDAGTMRMTTVQTLSTYIGAASVMNDLTDVSMDITNFVDGLLIQTDTNGSAPGTGTLNNATGNIGIGKDTFAALTTGDFNVFLGYNSGAALTTGSNNVAIGKGAGAAITEGATIVAIGLDALAAEDTDSDAVAIGANALKANDQGNHNIAIGKDALKANVAGSKNVAIGWQAGMTQANADSDDSIFIGYKAGTLANAANTGSVMIGSSAGAATTTGLYNTFIGLEAGGANTTGSYNLAIGYGPLDGPDTEDHNIAIGYSALGGSIAGGEYNVSIGNYSGDAVTSGDFNTSVGYNSGSATTTGYENTFIGSGAGTSCVAGFGNTCIGKNVDITHDNQHSIAIGYNISVSDNASSNNFIFGKSGNIVRNVFTTNASFARNSDLHKKTNIEDDTLGLRFINNLRTVKFNWRPNSEFPKHYNDYNAEENHMVTDVRLHGMIAQEVKTALDIEGVDTFGGWSEDEDGSQRISQEMFVHPLIRAVQELSAEVTELKKKLEAK